MKKLFSLLAALALVAVLSGCSSLTEPLNEHVTKEVTETEEALIAAIEEVKTELGKDPETVEVEVIIERTTYDVCIVDKAGPENEDLRLVNATVTEKPFSDVLEIEYDSKFGGRTTDPFDPNEYQIECKNIYNGE